MDFVGRDWKGEGGAFNEAPRLVVVVVLVLVVVVVVLVVVVEILRPFDRPS